jgi:hypothetical protein
LELQGLRFRDSKSGQSFKASEIKKGVGIPDLVRSGISLPKSVQLTPPLAINVASIVKDIAIKGLKFISKSQGIGY